MNEYQRAAAELYPPHGVGSPEVRPYRPGVGGPEIRPYRVGAPAVEVPGRPGPPVEYSQDAWQSGGNSYFGMGLTVIPANQTVPIQRNPIRPFTPLEFRAPSTVQGLEIVQMDIQGVQFFANKQDSGMPIELFSEVSRMLGFEWITIQPDTGIAITVRNLTGAPLNFQGGFQGTQLRK